MNFKEKAQLKLLEYFAFEATARSSVDSAYSHNSAILSYRKIRGIIVHHLDLDAHAVFDGQVEFDESCFCGLAKVNLDAAWLIKRRCLASSAVLTKVAVEH